MSQVTQLAAAGGAGEQGKPVEFLCWDKLSFLWLRKRSSVLPSNQTIIVVYFKF